MQSSHLQGSLNSFHMGPLAGVKESPHKCRQEGLQEEWSNIEGHVAASQAEKICSSDEDSSHGVPEQSAKRVLQCAESMTPEHIFRQ
jgi:hypothetical protein